MKLCKDCKHFGGGGIIDRLFSPFAQEFAKCHHPLSLKKQGGPPMITGRGAGGFYCSTMRGHDCGVEAKLYEDRDATPRTMIDEYGYRVPVK